MIDHLRIQNFKCLRDVSLDLGPLTVLVGPNDSGKTSILDATYLLGATTREPCWRFDPPGPHEAGDAVFYVRNQVHGDRALNRLVWRSDRKLQLAWEVRVSLADQKTALYRLQIPVDDMPFVEQLSIDGQQVFEKNTSYGELPKLSRSVSTQLSEQRYQDPAARDVAQAISSTSKYRFDPDALRGMAPPAERPVLSPRGDNLVAILDALVTGPNRRAIDAIEEILHEAVPNLSGVALQTQTISRQGATHTVKAIEFVLSGDGPKPITIPASLASDGAMLLLAYLALAYSDTPDILLIEEPENGLHPSRLKMVLDLLRKISRGEVGNRKRQVILTTQSPILLNYAEPEEVRIVRRNAEGATEVTPFTAAPGVRGMLEEFAIGELWFLLGEDGLLKGDRP